MKSDHDANISSFHPSGLAMSRQFELAREGMVHIQSGSALASRSDMQVNLVYPVSSNETYW